MEKGFLHWKADLITEYDPFETGLGRFVKLEKGDFVGRRALLQRQESGLRKRLVTLHIDATHAPAYPGASLMNGADVVGTVTSGDWGHRTGLNLAYAFVDTPFAAKGNTLEIDMCGHRARAEVIEPSPYDPKMSNVQS
jgi:dimethylglycine dehydrogenase